MLHFIKRPLVEKKYQETDTERKLAHHLIGNGNLI